MASLKHLAAWLLEAIQGKDGKTLVTPESMLTYPPVWYAVNKICGHIGQLPMVLHRRLPSGGAMPAKEHPAYALLKSRPNSWQTPVIFKELLSCHALIWGNGYAYIAKSGGKPAELLPLYPGSTAAYMIDGRKYFVHVPLDDDPILQYRKPDAKINVEHGHTGNHITLEDAEVFHIPGLGFDGLAGKALWKVASESVGIGISSDKRIRTGFEKGFKSAMLLEAPETAFRREEEAKAFIDDFNKYHTGSENADRVGLLTRGVKANVTAMNSQESQMVEHRRYQRQDAALWFLLESILGDDSSVSYNSLEQKNLAYLSNCLMRWLVKWEEEARHKLLTDREIKADTHYFKFNVAALLRADYKTTIDALSVAVTGRILNPNEAREKIDLNPYEGGDEYANPAITPGSETDDEPDDPPQDRPNNALRSRVAQLMKVEKRRVLDHTGSKNFCEWVDSFYAGWSEKLGDAVEELGGDRVLAERHCRESKEQLLKCAGDAVTTEELAAVVGECVSNWDSRVDGMTKLVEQAA